MLGLPPFSTWPSLYTSFQWAEGLALAQAFRESAWMFAIVQSIHLVALSLFGGALLLVDLRLLGQGLKQRPLASVARDAQPWLMLGFIVLLITGVLQFVTKGVTYYENLIFGPKMQILAIATIFTFTIRHKVTRMDESRLGPVLPKLVGLVSIALWTLVTVGGRVIGYFV